MDDESYNSGHGNAYEFYGCSKEMGCITVVRPDQREFLLSSSWLPLFFQRRRTLTTSLDVSAVTGIEQHNVLKDFFASCLLPASK